MHPNLKPCAAFLTAAGSGRDGAAVMELLLDITAGYPKKTNEVKGRKAAVGDGAPATMTVL